MLTVTFRRSRRFVVAALAGLVISGVTVVPASARPTPTPSRTAPAAFACATTLFPFATTAPTPAASGTRTPEVSLATPAPALPAVTSTVGGPLLATTGRVLLDTRDGAAPPPLRATAWLVGDLDSGDVLAACNPHLALAPASTLKVLTALALLDAVPARAVYTATDADAATDGTRVGLVPRSRYTADNLWHALLMSSANDSAHALAELAGGQARAVELLQSRALALGAGDTRVANTSGLDAPGQTSSAYDLALFARAALADRRITALATTRSYAFPQAGTALRVAARKTFQIQNHNRLLYNYPGATGLKNGWTSQAGGSFIGTAARGGHRYVAVILRADTNTWRATAALLDWAFAHGPRARAVGTLNAPALPSPAAATATPTAAPTATAPGANGQIAPAAQADSGTPPGRRPAYGAAAALAVAALGLAVGSGIVLRRRGIGRS